MGLDAAMTVGRNADVIDEVTLAGRQGEAGNAVRNLSGHIAWQERMVEMKQNRQQLEELLPMLTHRFQCPLSPGLIYRIIASYERGKIMRQPTDLNSINIQTESPRGGRHGKSVTMVTTGNSPVNLFSIRPRMQKNESIQVS